METKFTESGLSRVDFEDEYGDAESLLYGVDKQGEFIILLKDARNDNESPKNYETIVVLRRDLDSGWWTSPRWFKLNVGRGGSKLGLKEEQELPAVFLDQEEAYAAMTAQYKFNQREVYGTE